MYTLENHVGRLMELRVESPVTLDQLQTFHSTVARLVKPHSGQVAICTDLMGARVFPQPVTDRWTAIIQQENPAVERNAVLVGESAVFSMQVERILREAGSVNRRSFRAANDLVAWLATILTQAERTRLNAFLREGVEMRRSSAR